jgi:hypothetical protein
MNRKPICEIDKCTFQATSKCCKCHRVLCLKHAIKDISLSYYLDTSKVPIEKIYCSSCKEDHFVLEIIVVIIVVVLLVFVVGLACAGAGIESKKKKPKKQIICRFYRVNDS